jgi:hypothetical protein
MRWVMLLILAYITLLAQTTFGHVLAVNLPAVGPVAPDLSAAAAVFFALRLRNLMDALIAAAVLGLGVDLVAGVASAAVGPMPMAYALGAWAVFAMADVTFRDRPLTQALLAVMFCLMAHIFWVTAQSLLGLWAGWGEYARMLAQAGGLAVYTAALAPLVCFVLRKADRLLIVASAARGGREGR